LGKEIKLKTIFKFDPIGKKKRGRPKTRWKGSVLRAMEECGLREGGWEDRTLWRLGVEKRCPKS
jgi:hypothetical protein